MNSEEHAADAAGSKSDRPEPTDTPPEVHAAAEAVETAKAALHEAQQCYERIREETSARLERVRETRVGDLIDGALRFVRKHPGPSVILAILAGFFLGRGLRR